jgi:hypothetical protein
MGYQKSLVLFPILLTACVHTRPEQPAPAPYVISEPVISEVRGVPAIPNATPPPKRLIASEIMQSSDPEPRSSSGTVKGNYPVAQWIPGSPGFVSSPYGAEGKIDVRQLPPGSLAKDPYTGKIFEVPTR